MPEKDIAKEIGSALQTLQQSREIGSDVAEVISLIFSQSNDIEYLRKKSISSIKDKVIAAQKNSCHKSIEPNETIAGVDEEKLLEEIEKFIDSSIDFYGLSKKKYFDVSNINSKKNLKKIIQNFAIYQVYKVMNPKRIAGESKKINYIHNLMRGGQKLAAKYEGGKESDLKRYGQNTVNKIHRAVGKAKKLSRGFGR